MFKVIHLKYKHQIFPAFIMLLTIAACHQSVSKVDTPEPVLVPVIVQADKDTRLNDMLELSNVDSNQYRFFKELVASKEVLKGGVWSKDSNVLTKADTMIRILEEAPYYGLLSRWYDTENIRLYLKTLSDSANRLDLSKWALLEIKMTHSFLSFCNDVHFGRIKEDSIDQRRLRSINDSMAVSLIQRLKANESIGSILSSLEPRHRGYQLIKERLNVYIPQMDHKRYTFIAFPWKDSLLFIDQLSARLTEAGYMEKDVEYDSVALSKVIKKAQIQMGLKVDGKAGTQLTDALNKWDYIGFARMAINMERYKLLPDSMPHQYAFVNIPSFSLRVFHDDTVAVKSKVIVGKPKTPSPVLNSKFANLVLYPQWTVPYSIVFKEIAPKMAKDPTYLKAENMFIVDKRDSLVDPAKIKWAKINPGNFHYQIRQGEGIDNSLGIFKFNFANKYAVYLHDTNARSLFSAEKRMFSHGCIRVEKWLDLASYLIQPSTTPKPSEDLKKYLNEEKKRGIALKTRVPLFIRYFTWFELDGELKYFQDGYGTDNELIYNYLRE